MLKLTASQSAKLNLSRECGVIKNWKDFCYGDEAYALDHLAEFEWDFRQAAVEGKEEKVFPFVVEFGLHCFTKGPNQNKKETLSSFDKALYYADSRETRVFCFERYELSKLLPEIAKTVAENPCYHTGKGNFFTIELQSREGKNLDYEVYFQVSKTKGERLRLFVESAYIRGEGYASSQPKKKKIKFFLIANHRLQNKPIKVPR